MQRMRTIKEAYKEIKEKDKDTALTVTGLRRLVNEGEIPSVKVGNKTLIAMDNLDAFLHNCMKSNELKHVNKIRRVL